VEKIEVNPSKQQTIDRKMAAYLASDKALKDSAQRAFNSYIKSVYLMKNKNVFNVNSIDLTKFAESLGLATTPRVRFLERQVKNQQKQGKGKEGFIGLETGEQSEVKDESDSEQNESNDKQDNADEGNKVFTQDDDSDDDIFTVKRKDHNIDVKEGEEEDILTEDLKIKKDSKVLTKAQMAKKMMKKKIQANTKVNFDEEGEVVSEATKQKLSKEGKDYEDEDADRVGGGINIEKAKQVLKAEDQFDKATERARIKEKHKEDKRKQKEENRRKAKEERGEGSEENDDDDDDYSEPDLSWLPDPDKIYGKEEGSDEEDDGQNDSDAYSSDSENTPTETVEVKEGKRKLTVIKSVIPAKRSRQESSDEESEDEVLDTGLSLGDDEDLAMKLLSR